MNIAIDGPSGAGKSTVAKIIAARLGILHLDTGAMYRALGLFALRAGMDPKKEETGSYAAEHAKIDVRLSDGGQVTLLDGEDVSGLIRTQEVSAAASAISAHKPVREYMTALQRSLARDMSLVLDGRDIGTAVLPYCRHKFFVTASAEERARRRMLELEEKLPFETVLRQINERDEADRNREIAPLRMAEDARLIITDGITAEQAADIILAAVAEEA